MKQFSSTLFLVLSLVFSAAIVSAQGRTVTGVVQDANGNPLPNVSYLIKGTKTGGVTDANGHFSVNAASSATLVFSSVGFTAKEVKVGDQNDIAVVLSASEGELNEVVVTALGIKR